MNIWTKFSKLWAMYRKGEHLTRTEARQQAIWQLRCETRDNDPREAKAWDNACAQMNQAEGEWLDNGGHGNLVRS